LFRVSLSLSLFFGGCVSPFLSEREKKKKEKN